MDIIKSLEWRYSCKKFNAKKTVSDSKLDKLKKAFNLTATSFGLQPIKLIVVKNQEIKEQLQPLAYNQLQISSCSHLLIICIDASVGTKTIDEYFNLEVKTRAVSESSIEKFRNQLKEIYLHKTSEEIEKSSINQAYIALGNLLNVCALEQIDSCPMEGFIPEKFDELLDLNSKNLKSVLLLPIGYRADDDFMKSLKKVRKPLEQMVFEI